MRPIPSPKEARERRARYLALFKQFPFKNDFNGERGKVDFFCTFCGISRQSHNYISTKKMNVTQNFLEKVEAGVKKMIETKQQIEDVKNEKSI